jgi:O-antigen/teichoic acid export membrane protein
MTLAKSFSIYTVASFFNKGLMAVLAFFLTNYILPEQNSILSLYNVFTAMVLPFVIMGMPAALPIAHAKMDAKEYRLFFNSSLALSTSCFLLLLILFLLSSNLVTGFLAVPFRLLLMGVFYTYFILVQENMLAYLRTLNKPVHFLILSAAKDITEIGLVVLLVIAGGKGAEGRIVASVVAAAIIFAYGLLYFYRQGFIHLQVSKKYIKQEFKFGISQIFFLFNVFVLNGADKFFIHYLYPADKAGLGIYALSFQFAFIINVVVSAFFFSYQPLLYRHLTQLTDAAKYKLVKIKYLFAAFLLCCVILLSVSMPLVYRLFINQQYAPGVPYVACNAAGFFFWGLYALMLGFLYYYKKNKLVIALSVFSTLLCITTNYFFIKQMGIRGAAYANLLTYCLLFATAFIVINWVCRLQLPWLQFKKIFARQAVEMHL